MQRFVRVQPAPGKPKVSHPGQGLLVPGTQSVPRFIGYRRLSVQEAQAKAAELGVLPRQVDLYEVADDEVHPLRTVKKAIERGELLVTGATVAADIGRAKKQIEAEEAKASSGRRSNPRKASAESPKESI